MRISLALSLVILPGLCAEAQTLYERPVLIVDPDMHTAISKTAVADAAGRFLATGSHDKTVRIWSALDGKLLRTVRVPAGPRDAGRIYAVAMSPDGSIVAAGGSLSSSEYETIYLFDRNTGNMTNEFSREDEKWNNGAFTKVLLDGLGKDGDVNHDGFIWMTQLTHYVATHVRGLTEGQQNPGVEQQFEGEVFIAGQ